MFSVLIGIYFFVLSLVIYLFNIDTIVTDSEIINYLDELDLDNNFETDIEDDDDSAVCVNVSNPSENNETIFETRQNTNNIFDLVFDEEITRIREVVPESISDKNYKTKKVDSKCSAKKRRPKSKTVKEPTGEEIHRKWRKQEKATVISDYSLPTGVDCNLFAHCNTGTEIFIEIVRETLENIVYQSNLYATQRHKNLSLSLKEQHVFLDINMIMGYNILPLWKDYWSYDQDLHNPETRDSKYNVKK
ncbi:uncharacterized protein LOC142321292 [Lycorma delicatula]|uniref:uncharacterized protein LOC142321292 n=1 Tax=Lycorma delicatula TaxID=130591 RepID=UPI003F5177E8